VIILPVSDLHFEFHDDRGVTLVQTLDAMVRDTEADVLVIAGDLATACGLVPALELICKSVSIPIVYVTGNHEHYRSSLAAVRTILRTAKLPSNLHWLDRSTVTIDGVRFVGTTLWFEYTADARRMRWQLNDFVNIAGFEKAIAAEGAACRQYLRDTVRKGDVVVTHHLPSHKSVSHRFRGEPSKNVFYVTPQDDLIADRGPCLWLHGHTHDSCDYSIHHTRVVCNPYGYENYETNPHFAFDKIVRVVPKVYDSGVSNVP
jgi:Icc-related predicted phosphoesterase